MSPTISGKDDSPEEPADDTGHQAAAIGNRMIAAWEIASVAVSALIAEWLITPFAVEDSWIEVVPLTLAGALMLFSHRVRGETAREIGWRIDNLGQAVVLLIPLQIGASAIIIGFGWLYASLHFTKLQAWQWLLWLPVWALIQQYALQGFINRRAQIICGRGYQSVLLVAGLFALFHAPNPWLTLATFVAGLFWASVYQREPNLLALALSQALMSLTLVIALPGSVLHSLRVGFRYFG
jgi:membrane protease YdiL (CAAX protease family)